MSRINPDKAGLQNLKISVVTAVYNNRDTVGQALDSALTQDDPDAGRVLVGGTAARGMHER
jgi:hypothetical protein